MADYDRKRYALIEGKLITRSEFETMVRDRWGQELVDALRACGPDMEVEIYTLKLSLHEARVKELQAKLERRTR